MTDRRSFLRGTSVLMAHASFPQVLATFLTACGGSPESRREPVFFSHAEMTRLEILVDLILPATDSPAASQARTPELIDAAMSACATIDQQTTFRAGLAALAAEGFDTMNVRTPFDRKLLGLCFVNNR